MKLVSRRILAPIFATVVGLSFSAGVALAEITFSGSARVDMLHNSESVTTGFHDKKKTVDTADYTTTGRLQLNATAEKKLGDRYIKSNIELEADPGGDDAAEVNSPYVTYGGSSWFLRLGDSDVLGAYGAGQDFTLVGAGPDKYEGDKSAGNGIQLNVTLNDMITGELAVQYSGDGDLNTTGFRPAAKISVAGISVGLAGETWSTTEDDPDAESRTDGGGSSINIEGALGAVTIGVTAGSYLTVEKTDVALVPAKAATAAVTTPVLDKDGKETDEKVVLTPATDATAAIPAHTDETTVENTTAGAYAKVSVGGGTLGVGGFSISQNTKAKDKTPGARSTTKTEASQTQGYISYNLPLAIDSSYIEVGYSTASGNSLTKKDGEKTDKSETVAGEAKFRLGFSF